jgi:hypothetical protein
LKTTEGISFQEIIPEGIGKQSYPLSQLPKELATATAIATAISTTAATATIAAT